MFHNRVPGNQASTGNVPSRASALEQGAAGNNGGVAPKRYSEPTRNPLGMLIEYRFAEPNSPCRSYSELERRSGVSREALSRYITARPDRRRSPTIDTLSAIATALDMNIEALCRAGSMRVSARPDLEQLGGSRSEQAAPLLGQMTEDQFHALMAFLRQMVPSHQS
ncbi:MAG TPA: helix-turn-helix transcriptional regulator [Ktedonobacterales bacterium]